MKLSFLGFLAMALFAFSSCSNDSDVMTDAELIQAIQTASDKQMVSAAGLPTDALALLTKDFTESYVDDAQLAAELGYEVRMRRGTGTRIGERSDVYFNLEGRELRADREREVVRGEGGRDREECFRLAFPVTVVMPDGTEISGNAEELRMAVRQWYADNPGSEEHPTLQFPVELELADGTTVTINSDEELRGAYERCEERSATDFDCPDLRADFGDACYKEDRTEGTVNSDCECE